MKREKQNKKVNSKKRGMKREKRRKISGKRKRVVDTKNNAQEFEKKCKQVTIVITLSMLF